MFDLDVHPSPAEVPLWSAHSFCASSSGLCHFGVKDVVAVRRINVCWKQFTFLSIFWGFVMLLY